MWGAAGDFLLSSITHLSRWISKAGCIKEGECFIGWNGAIYGNNCIAFDQSVEGSLDAVLKIPSRWKEEAERSSDLERRQVQETFSFFKMFRKMDSRATCETSESRSLSSTIGARNYTVTCMFLEKTCHGWIPLCCQFLKEFLILGSGWVIFRKHCLQLLMGLNLLALIAFLESHRDQCQDSYCCVHL